jgi:hypothetical protein
MQLRHQLLGLRRDARELVAELFLVPPARRGVRVRDERVPAHPDAL